MTWLYIPGLPSTSSRSAPEAMASISASSWQCQQLEASLWWRGKPSRSRDWSRRCGKVSFLKLLSGAMPEPSTVDHGVASWMASLAASRASRTASPAAAEAPKTRATSGRSPAASSSSPAPGGASSKTSPACSRRPMARGRVPSVSGETYSDWVLRLRADFSQRRKLVRAMSASGCSSSAWPTARASETMSKPGSVRRGMDPSNARLEDTVAAVTAKMWPTPAARDLKGANSPDHLQNGTGRLHLDQLPNFVAHLWSTPRDSDGEKGGPNMSFGAGGEPLPSMAANWMSPRVSTGPWQRQKNGSKKLTIDGQASRFTPPQPGDADGWRNVLARAPQFEPAVCRVADGVASRVDQLRMLGNGVVPLEAAHAFRTLVARLAARGSAGATFLCDLMEQNT